MTDSLNVAIVHYHLRPGGVTRVIGNAVSALQSEGSRTAVLVGDVPPDSTYSLENVRIVEGLSYDTVPSAYDLDLLVERLMQAAKAVLRAEPDIWHFHNHSLGKNLVLPELVCRLANKGHHVLLQIHDFPEDGRPANYRVLLRGLGQGDLGRLGRRLYPQAPQIHYAALNGRDRDYLAAAGVPESRLHLLPNAIWMWEGTSYEYEEAAKAEEKLFLYPTRAIRRKNLGEFVLWAAMTADGVRFATTLAPENPVAQRLHEMWVALAKELKLPVRFAIGSASRTHFSDLVRASHALVTTSVAEGFGLAFLEPWLVGRPIVGRNLPEVTAEFESAGIHLETLYPKLEVPLEWIGRDVLADRIREGLKVYLEDYGREMTDADVDQAVSGAIGDHGVDFGRLDEELQAEVVRKVAESPDLRGSVVPNVLCPNSELMKHGEENRKAVLEKFGLDQYGRRLLEMYSRNLSESPGSLEGLDAGTLLDKYLNPERFTLLRT